MLDGALKAFDRLEDKYIALEKKYKRLREKNKAETRELEKARGAYNELIMEVCQKFPNETRHQTALRYIRQREQGSSTHCEAKQALEG